MSNKNQTKPKMSMGKKALIVIGGALALVLILSYVGSTSGGGNNSSYQGGDLNAYNAKAGVGIKQLAANYKIASDQLKALQGKMLQMQQSLKNGKGNNSDVSNQKMQSLEQQNSSLNDQMQALQSQLAQLKATGRICTFDI